MVLVSFIILICYVSMFNDLLPKTHFGAGIPDIDTFRAVSYILFIGAMIHWSIKKDLKIYSRWIITLAIFYTIVFASITWSKYNYSAFVLRQISDTAFIPFFIAVLALNLFRKEKNAKLYIKNIIFAAFILSLISIFQMALAISKGNVDLRATGTLANPNSLAIILVMSIACLLYAKETQLIPKWFGRITTIFVTFGIICTVSRKGIFTMIVCFCLYYFSRKQYKSLFYGLFALLMIITGMFSIEIVINRFEPEAIKQSYENKWDMTVAGLQMFITNPIYGLGFEGYKDHYSDYFPFKGRDRYDAHNIFITALANYGIIGFLPFLYIFFIPLFTSYKAIRRISEIQNEHISGMAMICLTTVVPFMVNGWVAGGLFYSFIIMSLFYSNVALFLAVKNNNRHKKRKT